MDEDVEVCRGVLVGAVLVAMVAGVTAVQCVCLEYISYSIQDMRMVAAAGMSILRSSQWSVSQMAVMVMAKSVGAEQSRRWTCRSNNPRPRCFATSTRSLLHQMHPHLHACTHG